MKQCCKGFQVSNSHITLCNDLKNSSFFDAFQTRINLFFYSNIITSKKLHCVSFLILLQYCSCNLFFYYSKSFLVSLSSPQLQGSLSSPDYSWISSFSLAVFFILLYSS
uniref:Uncharacterized protein n=1 Tax=Noccaea caerulescens TaxID=107243 RepID=A0A1J3CFZ9_NOCCA